MENTHDIEYKNGKRGSFTERFEKNLVHEVRLFLRFLKITLVMAFRAIILFLKNIIKALGLVITGMLAYVITLFSFGWFKKVFVFSILFVFVYVFMTGVI